jgi:hypothetical protein
MTYGSINFVDVLLGVQKADAVKSLDLFVSAEVNVLKSGNNYRVCTSAYIKQGKLYSKS